MDCKPCADVLKHPDSGLYDHNCEGCRARSLARSPDFAESKGKGERTARYGAALAANFKDPERGNRLVHEWDKRLKRVRS